MSTHEPRIVCPECRKGWLAAEVDGKVHCDQCTAAFNVNNRVIDLLPDFDYQPSRGQELMEWAPLTEIYESRWWRKSGLFTLMTGISFDDEYERIVAALKLNGDELLLDLACGPGIFSRPFARLLDRGRVVGLDLSEPMLNYASRKTRDQEIGNLTLVRGSALDLPFPDNEFDRINCCGAVHIFPDIPGAISEIFRVLKTNGIFTTAVFRNWLPGATSRKIADWQYRKWGAKNFQPGEIQSLLINAGFTEFTFLHSKRYWQIASAEKHG